MANTPKGAVLPLCHEIMRDGGSCQEHRGIMFCIRPLTPPNDRWTPHQWPLGSAEYNNDIISSANGNLPSCFFREYNDKFRFFKVDKKKRKTPATKNSMIVVKDTERSGR